MRTLKKTILCLLEANDLNPLVALAQDKPRVVSLLVRISYDKDTLAGWRAIKAVGLIARELVKTDWVALWRIYFLTRGNSVLTGQGLCERM